MRFFCLFFLTERMMLVSVVHNRPDRTTCVCISKPLCTATSSLWPSSKTHFSPTEEKKEKKKELNSFSHCTVCDTVSCQMCSTFTVFYSSRDTRGTVDRLSIEWCLWSDSPYFTHFFLYEGGKKKKENEVIF